MSHGGADEPNLTPLLDVVLQLVMFFMLCANFVMEQVNESIKLPEAIAAKSLDSSQGDYVMLNLDARGVVEEGGNRSLVLDTPIKVKNRMIQLFELDKERAARLGRAADWEKGGGRSVVILRADKDCPFRRVYDVLQACRQAGYADVQLRTLLVAGQP